MNRVNIDNLDDDKSNLFCTKICINMDACSCILLANQSLAEINGNRFEKTMCIYYVVCRRSYN